MIWEKSDILKNIVIIGGGTGLSQLLRGLKWYKDLNIISIVAVTDDGGSSGIIRNMFEIPPPGDIRNNIVALSEKENLITQLLDYRFDEGFLKDHNLGNIILLALTRISGNNFPLAIKSLSDFLKIRGKVLPVSHNLIRLVGELEDGKIFFGETNIVSSGKKIKKIWLDTGADAFEESIEAIQNADYLILGPGSLFTSIITNLLVNGIKDAIYKSQAKKIYISNIMTQSGETNDMKLSDHLNEIENYMGQSIDFVIANNGIIPEFILNRYEKKGSVKVENDLNESRIIFGDLAYFINRNEPIVRHNSEKLSGILYNRIFNG